MPSEIEQLTRKRVCGNCRGEALAGEKPSGIRPSRCQCFTLALRFSTRPYGPARSPLAFGLARKEVDVCIPDPLAFRNGRLRRWKPFGLAREEVAGRRLLAAGSHTVFILYGAGGGMGSDLENGRSKQRPYCSRPLWRPPDGSRVRGMATDQHNGRIACEPKDSSTVAGEL